MGSILQRRPWQLVLVLAAIAVSLVIGSSPAFAGTKSTCNGAVCEEVTYSGGTVTQWKSTVYPGSGYNCRTARFWVNDALVYSKYVCGTGTLYAYADTPYYFSSGSKVCSSWVNEPGYPCITL